MKPEILIRLDDASPYMDSTKWQQIEDILDKYNVKPIVAIIPDNQDDEVKINDYDDAFWSKAKAWKDKGWGIALHGYDHKFLTTNKGLVPRNNYSEFAGVDYEIQKEKIQKGFHILKDKGVKPTIWVAPAHSFDKNTLKALKETTDINIISDGIALSPFMKMGFNWIPQQVCHVPKRSFGLWTVCLHPNNMSEDDFKKFDKRLSEELKFVRGHLDIKYNRFLEIYDHIFYFTYRLKRLKKSLKHKK